MSGSPPVVVVVVGPRTSPRRSATIARWVRALLPAALLVVAKVPPAAADPGDDVVTLDADSVDGPLSVAGAIGKALGRP